MNVNSITFLLLELTQSRALGHGPGIIRFDLLKEKRRPMIHIYLMKIVPDTRAPAQTNVRLSWHFKHASSPGFHKGIVRENF